MTYAQYIILTHRRRRARHRSEVAAHLKKRFDAKTNLPNVQVVDSHGSWLQQWRENFFAYDIKFLRSHLNLHPCPFDFQSLSVWAAEQRREDELKHMDYVDREAYRRSGFHGPFVLPSTSLFLDFCDELIDRYGLDDMVTEGTVEDVKICEICENATHTSSSQSAKIFEVRLGDGRVLTAKRVVCAVGPGPAFTGMRATKPFWAEDLADSMSALSPGDASTKVQHASALTTWLQDKNNKTQLTGRRVLVVGGGQTAAHLSKLAVNHGASSVRMCSRRRITKKPYDVDVKFMGDKRPDMLRQFHKLKEPKERLEFNKNLRGGGSMSSDVYASLVDCSSQSNLVLAEEVEVEHACWSEEAGEIQVHFDDGCFESFDFVWLATGGNFNMELIPIFASLQSQCPIGCVNGLPDLRHDLSWCNNVNFHVMGAYAQLQLGADALNLAGARSGSVLVARAILESWNVAASETK